MTVLDAKNHMKETQKTLLRGSFHVWDQQVRNVGLSSPWYTSISLFSQRQQNRINIIKHYNLKQINDWIYLANLWMSRACLRDRLLMKFSLHHFLNFFSVFSLSFPCLIFSTNSSEARYTLIKVIWSPSGLEKHFIAVLAWPTMEKIIIKAFFNQIQYFNKNNRKIIIIIIIIIIRGISIRK